MDSRYDNLRAWLLCAPATVAMLALNIWPACRELISSPPRPLMAELSSWAISSLVVGAQVVGLCGGILLLELPLAFGLALLLLRRGAAGGAATPAMALAAVAAGLSWRLLFGGSIGFVATAKPGWPAILLEVWRTLPLATLLVYAPLRRRGALLAEVAALDGASFGQTVRRVYLPMCRPAVLALAALHGIDYLRAAQAPLISVGSADRAIWTVLVALVAILALRVVDRPLAAG
jgi:ABC-type sugar transport system permease subunit